MEHQTADACPSAIGQDLLRSPDAQLFLGSAAATPGLDRMQALLRRCGFLDSKQRPTMDEVAREVKEVVATFDAASRSSLADDGAVLGRVAAAGPVLNGNEASSRSALGGIRTRRINAAPRPAAADDGAVLVTLLKRWDGLQSSKQGSWRFTRIISSWDGVTVNTDGRVTELNLNACGLNGENLLCLRSCLRVPHHLLRDCWNLHDVDVPKMITCQCTSYSFLLLLVASHNPRKSLNLAGDQRTPAPA